MNLRRRRSWLIALVVALVTPVVPGWPAVAETVAAVDLVDETTLLVVTDQGSRRADILGIVDHVGVRAHRRVRQSNVVEVRIDPQRRRSLSQSIRRDPRVVAVEPNHRRRATYTANDPFGGGQDEARIARFPQAWDVVRDASSVKVAVLDTGVDLAHPDLVGQLLPGLDTVDGDFLPQDDHGHGTVVAGIIGATADNDIGIAGAAFDVGIIPVKVLGADGHGTDADIIEGIVWAADAGADVINLSLGAEEQSLALEEAVLYARSKGSVVVASSGNEGTSTPMYPGAIEEAIAVGATDTANRLTHFSSFGPWVDIAAVGTSVRSTTTVSGPSGPYADGWVGTSFSAPLVSAAAALVLAADPALPPEAVADRLYATARDAGPTGRDSHYGHGVLDAFAAVGGPGQAAVGPTAGDGFETNDTFQAATLVQDQASRPVASATIAPEGDVDVFAFDVELPGTVTITVAPPTVSTRSWQAMDPTLALYGPNDALLSTKNATGLDEPETLVTAVSSPGRYRVTVRNHVGSVSGGVYTLDLDVPAPAATTTTTTTTTPPPPPPTTTTAAPTTTAPPASPAPPPPPARRSGYWMIDGGGSVYSFGDSTWHGNGATPGAAAVDLEPTRTGSGYWIVNAAGQVSVRGDATWLGNATGLTSGEQATSLSGTPSGRGYWIFTTKGRAVAFGDAPFLGDMSGTALNGPVLDSIPTPTGNGYYMVASDGGIFTFGDARFFGSMGSVRLNAPVQSLVPDPDGAGYWLVASDGGIFAFAADFHGSMGSVRLNRPISGMVGFNRGYLMVGEDGGIFTFGDAVFHGSLGSSPPAQPVVAVAPLQ